MEQPKYAIVIPAKNEEDSLGSTLESVVHQSIVPQICLVVDDGSEDETYAIVMKYSETYPFIQCIQRKNDTPYALGGHVISVFEYGRTYIDSSSVDYDFIVKLDADLSFDSQIVEHIFSKIDHGKWAIVSGTPYVLENGNKIVGNSPNWHTHGQFKFYNYNFLSQIDGLPKSLGWDTADNIIALSKGWKTCAFKDIQYGMTRRVGGKYSLVKGRKKHGIGCYVLGYSPIYFLLTLLHDLFKPPLVTGSISKFNGYITAMLQGQEKILDATQRKLLRKLLWSSLWGRLRKKEFEIFQQAKKQ